jgi:hypothetical protein
MVIFGVLIALSFLTTGPMATVIVLALWGLAVVLVLVSLAAALASGGLLSTDDAKSRTVAYRTASPTCSRTGSATCASYCRRCARSLAAGRWSTRR